GTGLAFGGQDQKSDDGIGHTRLKVNGEWQDVSAELRKQHWAWDHYDGDFIVLCKQLSNQRARVRAVYFQGLPEADEAKLVKEKLSPALDSFSADLGAAIGDLRLKAKKLQLQDGEPTQQILRELEAVEAQAKAVSLVLPMGVSADTIHQLAQVQVSLEQVTDRLNAEPPARALSPIVYDEKSKLFVLFGGDHLDYLMNDTWTFDPAKKKWEQRQPKTAPPPRANHVLKITDGKITLSGGYTYTSSTDYVGAQYREIDDGEWTYDIAANTWTGPKEGVAPNQRGYRTGRLHPDYYLQGAKPQAAEFQEVLKKLEANTWLATKPPQLPALNRDWGTAVLDPDRDLILRWSGGHSAHGGTDVLHYHCATNRWELCSPVEFPLGQLYSNTEYPEGYSFNRRPWITGHTYQSYGYDLPSKRMLNTGQTNYCYTYDPTLGDWTGRFLKPQGMIYNDCFYTLTLCATPQGLVCWTGRGGFFRFDAKQNQWVEQKLQGKLPGAVVDNSTVVYDSKRDRFLFAVKPYGDKTKYEGQLHALDNKTLAVSQLSPKNMAAATGIPYLCQIRYDEINDLLLVGGLLPADETGARRTPAYDCANNQWVSLKIGGTDPSGKSGRNVSLGLMYDAKRKLFWAVDTNSQVYVLRLDPKTADMQPLK
ncbi:MAG: hypothetical protein JNM56_36690, partial [Planctomycetia bacterium]|nr:hypothetical protein [Planctomycetia bacterium]